ncbi:MAG: type II toxin-antitoxin system RelB/DinJ family antitoxin [Burkholderiales bacterium]
MAANALVQTRINKEIKENAAHVLAAIGLTVSDAVRLLLTRIATEQALPFAPVVPNSMTINAIKELESGKGKKFASIEELMSDLK